MSANAFKISGILYNNMGTITINNHNYIIIANNTEFRVIEYKNIEGNIKYIFPNLNTTDENELKSILFVNEITNSLKNEISNGNIKTKEELSNKIEKIMDLLNNDIYIKSLFNNNIDEFKNSIKGIYSYFEQKKEDNLDLSNITSFDIEKNGITNSYIKRYDEDTKKVDILVNRGKENFVDQIRDEQNKEAASNHETGIKNASYTFDIMKEYEKEEVKLNDMDDNKNIVMNLNSNIFVNKNTGDVITTDVSDNVLYTNKVGEHLSNNTKKDDENITSYGIDEELLTADEIEKILTTKKESLTEEQIIMFEKLLEKKKTETISSAGAGVDKRLALNLSGNQTPDDVDTKAAYVNLIALCMFVQISMLLIIIGTVYFMK